VHTSHNTFTKSKVDIYKKHTKHQSKTSDVFFKESTMSERVSADKKPAVLELAPGTYYCVVVVNLRTSSFVTVPIKALNLRH
jgi:hypothetical protein